MEKNDIKILCRLRNNSRENLTTMSRKTNIPVSTLHDKIRRYQGNLIKKNTVILNFKKIGYDLRVNMLIKVAATLREKCEGFLKKNNNVNSLFRVNNGYDFLAEVLFKDMKEFRNFTDKIAEFEVNSMLEFFVLDDLKRESFMTEEMFHNAS